MAACQIECKLSSRLVCMLGSATVPELDSMWQKLASNPQVLQQMYSLPYIKTVLEGFEANPSLAQQVGVTSQFQVNKSMNCDRKESAVAGNGSFAVTIEMFTTRARSVARAALFSVVSVCLFVSAITHGPLEISS